MDLSQVEAELVDIDSQIAALQKRKDDLRTFFEMGKRLYGRATNPNSDMRQRRRVLIDDDDIAPSSLVRRDGSLKARIESLARQAITTRGPQTTREILALAEAAGIEVKGADKPTTVSVILSRSGEFKSDRTIGWTLVEKETPAAPEGGQES